MAGTTTAQSTCLLRGHLYDHRLRLSIAGLLVKLKPANVSVVELLQQLRARGTCKHPPLTEDERSDAVPTVSFGEGHVEAEERATKTRELIIQLGKENQRLQEEIEALKSSKANSQRKRKGQMTPSPLVKSTGQHEQLNSLSLEFLDVSLSSPEVDRCFGNLYVFQSIFCQQTPNLDGLAAILVLLTLDCISLVSTIQTGRCEAQGEPQPQRSNSKRPNQTALGDELQDRDDVLRLRLIKAVFSKILQGLSVLQIAGADILNGRVTYHVVKVFSTLLDGTRETCVVLGQDSDADMKANKGRKRRRLSKGETLELGSRPRHPTRPCHIFSELLFIVESDPHDYWQLRDGILFHVLTRAGALLKRVVFGEMQEHAASDDTEMANHNSLARDGDPRSVALEAPTLIWLLRRVLVFHQRLKAKRERQVQPENIAGPGTKLDDGVSEAALNKIQETLLKAVFPDDDDCFRQVFTAPEDLQSEWEVALPTINQNEAPNWFKSEVWRLVGWDVLRDMVAWES